MPLTIVTLLLRLLEGTSDMITLSIGEFGLDVFFGTEMKRFKVDLLDIAGSVTDAEPEIVRVIGKLASRTIASVSSEKKIFRFQKAIAKADGYRRYSN
jgi:hypothetical protein